MKKLLLGAAALFLMASCSGSGSTKNTNEESTRIADSIAQVEAEQARLDSIRQDSIAKAEELAKATAKYDNLVTQYVSSVNNIERAAKNRNFSNMHSLVNKYNSLLEEIDKIKNNLSPQQLSEVEKAEKKYKRLVNGVIAG